MQASRAVAGVPAVATGSQQPVAAPARQCRMELDGGEGSLERLRSHFAPVKQGGHYQ